MKKYLYKFFWDCGRIGNVEGLFIATQEEVDRAMGNVVSFGEILGKHSDVYGVLEDSDLSKIDIGEEVLNILIEELGTTWGGYNPLDYVRHECVKCEDSYHAEEIEYVDGEYICGYCQTESGEDDE